MTDKSLSRQMWQIALPAIIANISIPLLGLADVYILGHLPNPHYLGAIALGAMIISILYNSMNFLRLSSTGFTAQANGRGDYVSVPAIYVRASLCAILIGCGLIILQGPVAWLTFSLTEADHTVEILAKEYFLIRIWGAPFALMNFVAVGWLLGLHKAKEALMVQVFMNISNILLNFVFVYGLDMDIEGVAFGTIIAEFLASLLAFRIISGQNKFTYQRSLWSLSRAEIFNRQEFARLFTLNRDIFIRAACLTGAMASFTVIGATMGVEILAANAILMNLQMVTSYGLDGFAQAAEVLVGKEVGRKSRERLRRAVILSSKWALITAGLFSLFYFLFGDFLIIALTDIPDIRNTASEYMIWVIVLPLISIWSFQFDGIFIGATAGKSMRNGMIVSIAIYAASLYVFLPLWQNHGLWLCYCIFLSVRAITLAFEYPKIELAAEKFSVE